MTTHSLITTLKGLTGNPRGCVYTEPLWGIPFNLYAPYVSIYMLAIGLTDAQIGQIVSVSWGFQVILALLSGVITDKLGRRLTTLVFDILAWSVPALIAAFAQNGWYFLVAGIINSAWRITMNSWTCLLVEEADHDQLVDIYSWIYIANQIVGFVAPLTGIIIGMLTLVPTMRGLYLFAAVMFTLKALITYWMTKETAQGIQRMHETKTQSIFGMLREYTGVTRALLRAPGTLYTGGIMLLLSIIMLINNNFWSIIVTEKLLIPAEHLAIFPFVKSAVILSFFFFVMPRISTMHFTVPMMIGFLGFLAGQMLLVTAPEQGYPLLIISVVLEACSFAAVSPLVDKLLVLTVDPHERARIQSLLYMGVILLTAPFGWIAGTLSAAQKDFPFLLNMALCAIGIALAYMAGRSAQRRTAAETAEATA